MNTALTDFVEVCSKYKWRHSNDVIVIKILLYAPN